jgi:hypothetical protein
MWARCGLLLPPAGSTNAASASKQSDLFPDVPVVKGKGFEINAASSMMR